MIKNFEKADLVLVRSVVSKDEYREIKKKVDSVALYYQACLFFWLSIPFFFFGVWMSQFLHWTMAGFTSSKDDFWGTLFAVWFFVAPFLFAYLALKHRKRRQENEAFIIEHVIEKAAKIRLQRKVAKQLEFDRERARQLAEANN